MPVDILVPPLSQTLDTLVLVEWLKKVGDPVQKGEPLFTVETDKATLEVEAPADGVLASVHAQAGDEIQIRGVIGHIQEPGKPGAPEEFPALGEVTSSDELADLDETKVLEELKDPQDLKGPRIFASPRARQLAFKKGLALKELDGCGTGPQGMIVEKDVRAYLEQNKPRATPLAQRMAQEAGLDLTTVPPSQQGERIRKADVAATLAGANLHSQALAASSPTGPEDQMDRRSPRKGVPLSPTRKTIATRMTQSHQTSAPVTYLSEADATRLVKLRKNVLKEIGQVETRPTLTDFIIRITAHVLKKHPQLNATFDGSFLDISQAIHIGLAVDTERGLLVPVLPDTGQMGLLQIADMRSRLVQKALSGGLKPEEMSGGTFTLSNLGKLGIDHFTPIINPPQVAILGVGRLREASAVRKGKARKRYSLGLSVTCDHRVIDGAPAARFLGDICRLVEEPHLFWL
jgi:pyruvate dehydrogenase E2 component (dihydrolipoamide acetyltransferase)